MPVWKVATHHLFTIGEEGYWLTADVVPPESIIIYGTRSIPEMPVDVSSLPQDLFELSSMFHRSVSSNPPVTLRLDPAQN